MGWINVELAAHGVEEFPFFVGDGYTKLFKVPAGRVIGQHVHKIGHYSVLLIGHVRLRFGDQVRELRAPATAWLPENTEHSIEALSDSLWACNWPNADQLTDADELERSVIA